MEARARRRLRGRANDDRREVEEIVGLDDDGETSPVLCVAPPARERDLVDVTADHGGAP
jgi:hypothetical protein